MTISKNPAQKYVSLVKKELSFSSKSSRDFLHVLKQNINNYILEYPTASYSDLEAVFGLPHDVAASYYDTLEKEELDRHLNSKKRTLILIICSSLFFLSIFACYYYYNLTKELPAYTVEEIEVIE